MSLYSVGESTIKPIMTRLLVYPVFMLAFYLSLSGSLMKMTVNDCNAGIEAACVQVAKS